MRRAAIERNTKETQIRLRLVIEGRGRYKVSTGIRFFDHMLELFAHHGGFDLTLKCKGDLDVDQHHTVEDVGIALGEAFSKALGDKKGIMRAGYFVMAMRSEEHTSELQSHVNLVCRLLLEKKKQLRFRLAQSSLLPLVIKLDPQIPGPYRIAFSHVPLPDHSGDLAAYLDPRLSIDLPPCH